MGSTLQFSERLIFESAGEKATPPSAHKSGRAMEGLIDWEPAKHHKRPEQGVQGAVWVRAFVTQMPIAMVIPMLLSALRCHRRPSQR